jgi:hypothetical protein
LTLRVSEHSATTALPPLPPDGGDHQQLVIVDIGDDLRPFRDHGIERGAPGGSQRISELGNGRVLKDSILCDVTICCP